jgi:hypothetical protein
MSFNGSGTFAINSTGQPVVSGTVISSSTFNALTADLATGLSTCITKDGQTTVTANIPMNSYKITGLAAGTAATDAARVGQLQAGGATLVTVAGTDTYTGTMSPSLAAYAAGNVFTFVVPNTNTTAATLNIDGLGAKALTRDGSTALVAGDLVANAEVAVVYDGTRFQVLNSNSKTNFNLSGTLTVAGNTTLSGGTANGVAYLNASKVLTTGSALTFDGTNLSVSGGYIKATSWFDITPLVTTNNALYRATNTGGTVYLGLDNSVGGLSGAAYALNVYHTGNYPIVFSLNSAEQMRLTSTGLGIGTSSPGAKLDIAGTASGVSNNFRLTSFSFQNAFMLLNQPNIGTYRSFEFQEAGSTTAYLRQYGSAYGSGINSLVRLGNGSATLDFDSSGNLGLGVTPSAWSSYRSLSLGNIGSSIAGQTAANGTVFTSNAYYNAGWKYAATAAACFFDAGNNVGGGFTWNQAASGTAGNAITFTQAMTLNASGNLGIGTTNPLQTLVVSNGGAAGFEFVPASNIIQAYNRSTAAYTTMRFDCSQILFYTGTSPTESARIDTSGNLLVGTTLNQGSGRISIVPTSGGDVCINTQKAGSTYYVGLWYTNTTTLAGYISVSGSSTSYVTSSDRRMKENIAPANDSGSVIDTIEVVQHDWKSDKTSVRYGMVAQDLHKVAPEAVVVGDDGEEIDRAWGVDYSKLVPMLVKEIQSLRVRLNALENK